MIAMLQTREWTQRMIAALPSGGFEYALIDSGSGVLACPQDYAPEIPIEPVKRDPGPMVSVTNEPVTCIGTKTVTYILPNGEEMTITWHVTNVKCLILSVAALQR